VALERTVREMQADFATNSADADRRMLRAEIVAIASLIFAAVGFASSTYFSIKQTNDGSIVKELHAVRAEQQADRARLVDALNQLAKAQQSNGSQLPAKVLVKKPVPEAEHSAAAPKTRPAQ